MKVVTSLQMQEIDRRAIEEFNISQSFLMENAGKKCYEKIVQKFGSPDNKTFFIFCGKGNNGGDGLVVARHLFKNNAKVVVFLIGKRDDLKNSAAANFSLVKQSNIANFEITDEKQLLEALNFLATKPHLIVDALLGTGITGEVKGLYLSVIKIINDFKVPVLSVDVPSGVNSTTGEVLSQAVKATYTVTFGLPKIGFYLFPASEYVGELSVADIGFPEELLTDKKLKFNLITPELVKNILPVRHPQSHKGNFGHLLVLAGSPGFSGAAYLCSQAALLAGAGLVTLGIPERLNFIMEIKLTEVMTLPLPETPKGTLGPSALNHIREFFNKASCLAIGPGLTAGSETARMVRQLIKECPHSFVLDADGINCAAQDVDCLRKTKSAKILTPHPGEAARLLNTTTDKIQKDRIGTAKKIAVEFDCVAVLKGANTIISNGESVYINTSGNPGMASGGTGDVLTGIIAGLVAQKLPLLEAAIAGVYWQGLAGDIALKKVGDLPLTASDLLNNLAPAYLQIVKS